MNVLKNSIKTKVLISYLVIIFVMTMLVVGIVIISNDVLLRYEKTNNNIVLQQKLKELAFGLATDSYNGFKTNDYSKYNQRLAAIEEIKKQLDA